MSTTVSSDAASQAAASSQAATGPRTEQGKAVASRNATTHGLFARDIVLPSLGEDPDGYRQVQNELVTQLQPGNLLERHYVEKIAAASWRLRRLHRWQAQLFEDDALTEDARLDKLDKVLRHETHLHRQIDTAVKMLNKDVPQLYTRRVRDQVMLDTLTSERECRDNARDAWEVEMETRGRLRRIQKETEAALGVLSQAFLDTKPRNDTPDTENCQNEPAEPAGVNLVFALPATSSLPAADKHTEDEEGMEEEEAEEGAWEAAGQNCRNEPGPRTLGDSLHSPNPFPSSTGRGGEPLASRGGSCEPGRDRALR